MSLIIHRDDLPPAPEWTYAKPEPEPTIPANVTLGEN